MNEKSFVPIVLRIVGAFGEQADVVGLFLRPFRELDADFFGMQPGDFLLGRLPS